MLTKQDDAEELRWKGVLGHAVVVLTDGHGCLEANDMASARSYEREQVGHNPRIYKRSRDGKRWLRVATGRKVPPC